MNTAHEPILRLGPGGDFVREYVAEAGRLMVCGRSRLPAPAADRADAPGGLSGLAPIARSGEAAFAPAARVACRLAAEQWLTLQGSRLGAAAGAIRHFLAASTAGPHSAAVEATAGVACHPSPGAASSPPALDEEPAAGSPADCSVASARLRPLNLFVSRRGGAGRKSRAARRASFAWSLFTPAEHPSF